MKITLAIFCSSLFVAGCGAELPSSLDDSAGLRALCPGLADVPGVATVHWNPAGQYCWITCQEGYTACDRACLSEADLHTNEHCGQCGFHCEDGRVCQYTPASLSPTPPHDIVRARWGCAIPSR